MVPQHYSRDIPERCEALLRDLLPIVERGGAKYGDPLQTTFLLAMATPMIVLPVERLMKPFNTGDIGVAEDVPLCDDSGELVAEVFGEGKLFCRASAFFKPGHWSGKARVPRFNVAEHWPRRWLDDLASPEAYDRAGKATAWRVIKDLRNALAHGGVTYLDADGRHTEGEVAMLGFASAICFEPGGRNLKKVNLLRIHQDHFRIFLSAWAEWLKKARVVELLERRAA
ncbi:MAG: hypothetical protein ACR2F8_05070 [Caulobacteraceae bacterium]